MTILESFAQAIEIQANHDSDSYQALLNLPLSDQIAKGDSMANLTVTFTFGGQLKPYCRYLNPPLSYIDFADVICEHNISKFSEGQPVILANGAHRFKMKIKEDSVDRFLLETDSFGAQSCFIDVNDYPRNNWQIFSQKLDVNEKMLNEILQFLSENPPKTKFIEKLLNGSLNNSITGNHPFSDLNVSQNKAVSNALGSDSFYLIQGPPGTGKTFTIAHIAANLASKGLSVFVSGPTHTAINNCLNAIAAISKDDFYVVKIGEQHQATEIIDQENVNCFERFTYETFINQKPEAGIVIGATPYALCYPYSKKLYNWNFDVALVDEASQLSIPLAFPILARSKKVIFVGDHFQLDPIIPPSQNPLFSGSVFKLLADFYPANLSLLEISYRLNKQLIRIPNELFYSNRLSSALPEKKEVSLSCKNHPDILNHNDAHVLVIHEVFDAQGRSPFESEVIAELVSDLLSNGVRLSEIAIISPYRAQVREIKKCLLAHTPGFKKSDLKNIFIDTVDKMQGQEKQYLIYSLANAHPLESKRNLDFFFKPNRLNVAITRAKTRCIVLANYKVFDFQIDQLKLVENYEQLKPSFEIFKKYYDLSSKVFLKNKQEEVVW